MLKIKRPIALVIVAAVFSLYILKSMGVIFQIPVIFINKTASEPRGIYVAVLFVTLKHGDKVIITPPESVHPYVFDRGWLQPGQTMLKTVYGLPGDTYSITDREIQVNGTYRGPIYEYDSKGLPLPQLRGTFTVQEGYFLPLALYAPKSFDGRYFGEVSTSSIVRKVVLIYAFD